TAAPAARRKRTSPSSERGALARGAAPGARRHRRRASDQGTSTISIQFGFFPIGYSFSLVSFPLSESILYVDRPWDSCPTASRYRPEESMLKPRGCFSVGTLPMGDSAPVPASTLNPARVLDVRSDA